VIGLLGLMLIGSTISWYFAQHPFLLTRIERTGENERSVDDRLALWTAARDAFYEHPVLGIGYGQFRYYASARAGTVEKVTHETYLSFAAELGLIGLIIFVWMMSAVLVAALRWRLTVGDGLSTICFAFVFACCIQALFNNVDQFRSLWIAIGLVAAIGAARRRELLA
jgi:O-antigen ligase